MVDRLETRLKGKPVTYFAWNVYEVEVSQNDIITLDEFATTENLKKAVLIRKDNGAEMATTINKNVVTVTNEGTNVPCILFAFGVKA